jgi:hypothetical protein
MTSTTPYTKTAQDGLARLRVIQKKLTEADKLRDERTALVTKLRTPGPDMVSWPDLVQATGISRPGLLGNMRIRKIDLPTRPLRRSPA